MDIIRAARSFKFGSQRSIRDNDFFSDRLSHRHTTKILIVFLVLATFKRFFSSPINCWVPAELKRYEKFMNRYCWLKGTYYVNQNYDLNTLSIEAREETLLYYYQWVYFFLIFQAFLFYFPRMLWCFISNKILDYDLFNMVDACAKHEIYAFDSNKVLKYVSSNLTHEFDRLPIENFKQANYIRKIINNKALNEKQPNKSNAKSKQENINFNPYSFKAIIRRLSKSYLTFSYILVKLIYLLLAFMQILIMNKYLSNKSHNFYGFQVLETILNGEADIIQRNDSRIFPRITICDVKTRELGQDHVYSLQCVLSFNLFNERIYAFLWMWIFFILIPFTLIDLIAWVKRVFIFGSNFRYKFIKERLLIYNPLKSKKERLLVKLFTEFQIGMDGVFILRLLEHNSTASVVSELINKMWIQFKTEQNL